MLLEIRAVLSSIKRIYVLVRHTDCRTAYQEPQPAESRKTVRVLARWHDDWSVSRCRDEKVLVRRVRMTLTLR